jgi:hypothetical protein
MKTLLDIDPLNGLYDFVHFRQNDDPRCAKFKHCKLQLSSSRKSTLVKTVARIDEHPCFRVDFLEDDSLNLRTSI